MKITNELNYDLPNTLPELLHVLKGMALQESDKEVMHYLQKTVEQIEMGIELKFYYTFYNPEFYKIDYSTNTLFFKTGEDYPLELVQKEIDNRMSLAKKTIWDLEQDDTPWEGR